MFPAIQKRILILRRLNGRNLDLEIFHLELTSDQITVSVSNGIGAVQAEHYKAFVEHLLPAERIAESSSTSDLHRFGALLTNRVALFVRVPGRIGSAHHPVNRRTTGTKSLASRIARLPLH